MPLWLKYLLAFWCFIMLGAVIVMRLRFRRASRRRDQLRRCVCGYALEHLEVPRCPECGRLFGFKDKTLADVGVTEEEAQAYAEKKRRQRDEKAAKPGKPTPG